MRKFPEVLVLSAALILVFAINYVLALAGYPTSLWLMQMLGVTT